MAGHRGKLSSEGTRSENLFCLRDSHQAALEPSTLLPCSLEAVMYSESVEINKSYMGHPTCCKSSTFLFCQAKLAGVTMDLF